MFLTHSAYFSAAGLMTPMQRLPPDKRPQAPADGQFHADLRVFGSELNASWRGRVALFLGKLAGFRGDVAKAKRYGETAIQAFEGFTDVPPAARKTRRPVSPQTESRMISTLKRDLH